MKLNLISIYIYSKINLKSTTFVDVYTFNVNYILYTCALKYIVYFSVLFNWKFPVSERPFSI